VSKAFTKDDDTGAELLVVPRAPLAEGLPNYVTARGLRLMHEEQARLEDERAALAAHAPDRAPRLNALSQRAADLQARISSAQLVGAQPKDEVRFGACVRVRHGSGKESEYLIVGVDEADAASGRVAFSSPVARSLLGKRVAEMAEVRTPRGRDELEVLEIRYPEAGPEPEDTDKFAH